MVLSATFTKDRYSGIRESRAKNLEYEQAIDDFAKLIQRRNKIQEDYRKIQPIDINDRLDKMVPNNVDNIRLIIDIGHIIARHGVYAKDIKATSADAPTPDNKAQAPAPANAAGSVVPQNPLLAQKQGPSASKLSTVTVNFSVSTSYSNMIDILKDIESSLRIMNLTEMSFNSTDVKDGTYDFSVAFETYWLKE